jgi:replicative DNA helicase
MINLPHAPEAEASVIGALLVDPTVLPDCVDHLTDSSFHDQFNRQAYTSVLDIDSKGGKIDALTVSQGMNEFGYDSFPRLVEMMGKSIDMGNIVSHCLILREKEIAREQISLATEIQMRALNPAVDPLETSAYLSKEVQRISELSDISKPRTNTDLIDEVKLKMLASIGSGGITGVPTGFDKIDSVYAGRQRSDLIIKAGRPGMGKTAQALCEFLNISVNGNMKAIFFSLEMSAEQLMQRLISIHTEIPLKNIRTGDLWDSQWDQFDGLVEPLKTDNMMIVDDVYTLNGIRSRARKIHQTQGVDIIFIDYLQLIEDSVKKGWTKEAMVSGISRALKMLAKQLNVPVIALSQLSRKCEERADKKPMLSDLRDSGAIEQDADVVEFMYRPSYYELVDEEGMLVPEDVAYLLIEKHRHGATYNVELTFKPECAKFQTKVSEIC